MTIIPRNRVFFCGEFSPPGDPKKNRDCESNQGIFENLKKEFAISREKKEG